MVTGGRIGDLYGRKKTFLAGTAVFGIASLACGLSPGVWWVIGWRVVQGVGGALMWPSASVIALRMRRAWRRLTGGTEWCGMIVLQTVTPSLGELSRWHNPGI